MSSEHDLQRAVRAWMREGLESLPDRYLDAALDEIATTHQRRRRASAWRPSEMNSFARLGLAAAAAILVAMLGWTMLFNGGPLRPAASPSAAASPTAAASSNAKQLEALLPANVGGVVLFRRSQPGRDWVAAQGEGDATLVNWVTSAGKSLDDVSEASATSSNNGPGVYIDAFRVNGVDHTVLLSTLQTAMKSHVSWGPWTTTILGGKTVQAPTGSGQVYLYGTADIIFYVSASDRALVAKAFAALP